MSDRQWYEYPSLVLQIRELSHLREDLREKNLFEAPNIRPKDDTASRRKKPSGHAPRTAPSTTSDPGWRGRHRFAATLR